jgi:hypothetical protein
VHNIDHRLLLVEIKKSSSGNASASVSTVLIDSRITSAKMVGIFFIHDPSSRLAAFFPIVVRTEEVQPDKHLSAAPLIKTPPVGEMRRVSRIRRDVVFVPRCSSYHCSGMVLSKSFLHIVSLVALVLLTVLSSSVASSRDGSDAIVILAHDMIGGEEHSSSSIGIPVSPSCWASAMIALLGPSSPVGTTDAASFCANLPETSQKRLALELARCHLEDMQKPLFQSPRMAEECSKTSLMLIRSNESALRSCLSGLTDAGEHAYTHYMPYLQALCIRKTQELFLRHQQSIKDDLAAEYAEMSRSSIEHMESVQQSTARHAEELNAKLTDMPLAIQNQLADQLSELIGKELGERLAQAMEQQTNQQSEVFSEILGNIQLQDLQRQQQHDDWGHYQAGMFLKQAQEMERQRDALRESRERIEDLSSKVSKTSMTMQPLVGLETFMKAATEGYSWISFLLYFLATFNVVWVMTRPARCHRFRLYIFTVVITEAVMELAMKLAVTHGLLDDVDRLGWTTELRRLALLLECMTYVAGLLMSLFIAASSGAVDKEQILDALIDRHIARISTKPVYHEYEDFVADDDETPHYPERSEIPSKRSYEHPLLTQRVQHNHVNPKVSPVAAGGRSRNATIESPPGYRPRHHRPLVQRNARTSLSSYGDGTRLPHDEFGQSPIVIPPTPAQQQQQKQQYRSTSSQQYGLPLDFLVETIDPPPPAEESARREQQLETMKPTKVVSPHGGGGRRRAAASPPDEEPNAKKKTADL